MRHQKLLIFSVVISFVFTLSLGMAIAQEHPSANTVEHPSSMKKGAPSCKIVKNKLTKQQLAAAISSYINKETALKGGYFLMYDKKAHKDLVLTLLKVHKDRLSTIGNGIYFACTDFKTKKGKIYDLDFFMKGSSVKNMVVTDISIHKEAGVARYTWFQKNGIWMKKLVK